VRVEASEDAAAAVDDQAVPAAVDDQEAQAVAEVE